MIPAAEAAASVRAPGILLSTPGLPSNSLPRSLDPAERPGVSVSARKPHRNPPIIAGQ
jgi:hypothetical protein